jgi:hypothetical protein
LLQSSPQEIGETMEENKEPTEDFLRQFPTYEDYQEFSAQQDKEMAREDAAENATI